MTDNECNMASGAMIATSCLSVGEPGHVPMPDYHTERVRLKHGLRRSASTGQFHIDQRWDLVGNPDPYPPARVIDLQIDGVDRKERRVTLSWTAPGSNLDTGTGSLKGGWYLLPFEINNENYFFINTFICIIYFPCSSVG